MRSKKPTVVISWKLLAAVLALYALSCLFALAADRAGADSEFTTRAVVEAVNDEKMIVTYKNGYGEWVTREVKKTGDPEPGERFVITLRTISPAFMLFTIACIACRLLPVGLILWYFFRGQKKPRGRPDP